MSRVSAQRTPEPRPEPGVVERIIIHCTGSRDGRRKPLEEIDRDHGLRGFARRPQWRARMNPRLLHIGYHWVIQPNGACHSGRHTSELGAHARGWNQRSLGVCIVGTTRYTLGAWTALASQVAFLCAHFAVPLAPISGPRHIGVGGHRDLSPDRDGDGRIEPDEWVKTCPGFDVADWLAGGLRPPPQHVFDPSLGD